ncbi:MAG: CBS domain-containing protein [Candidatus Korobacteraceae bacterium]
MTVRDLMTSHVTSVTPEATLEEIATLMRDEDVGSIPVVEDHQLLGIVTDRDIVIRCIAQGKFPSETSAEEAMTSDIDTIEADADVVKASLLMGNKQIRRLPVMDDGELVGMLSLGDIAVKQHELYKNNAGEALQEISQSTKHGAKAAAEKHERQGRPTSGQAVGKAQPKKGREQGISNHDVEEESARQARVLPFREEGKRKQGRKAG